MDVTACLRDIPGCIGLPTEYLVGAGAVIFVVIALAAMAFAVFRRTPAAPQSAASQPTSQATNQPAGSPLPNVLDGPPRPDDPEWVSAAIRDAQVAPGSYTSGQATNGWTAAKRLRRDWKMLNQVLGTSTADTTFAWWGGGLGIGGVTAYLLPAFFGASLAWYVVSFALIMTLTAFVAYNRWMNAIFKETYLPNSVRLRQRPGQINTDSDIIIAWVRRLGLVRRPELLEGNQGHSGFRDQGARVKTMAPVGKGLGDFLHGSDFYDLQADTSCIAPDVNTTCYALDLIARRGGAAHAASVEGPPKRDWARELRRLLPWLLPLAVMGVGIIVLAAGADSEEARESARSIATEVTTWTI